MNPLIQLHDSHIHYSCASARHRDVNCVPHLHHSMEVILVNEGTLNMTVSSREYQIPAGSGIFVPSFEVHAFDSPTPNRCHVLMFTQDLVPQFFTFLQTSTPQIHLFTPSPAAFSLSDSHLPEEENHPDYFTAMAVLSPLLAEILAQCRFAPGCSRQGDSFYKTVTYMNEHFLEDISLTSTAKAVGLHPVTLSRLFSEKFKSSFSGYLNYLRCSHAARLLKNSGDSCAQIALQSGFGSIRSFNRAFQELYGTTPTQFRRAGKA